MPAGGGSSYQPDPVLQRRAMEERAQRRDYSFEEPSRILRPTEVAFIAAYQDTHPISDLLRNPVPPAISTVNSLGAMMLANNTADFDPPLEERLASDPIIRGALSAVSSEEKVRLICTRRSLSFLIDRGHIEQTHEAHTD